MFTRKSIAWIPTPFRDKVEVKLICAVLLRGRDLNYFQRDSMQGNDSKLLFKLSRQGLFRRLVGFEMPPEYIPHIRVKRPLGRSLPKQYSIFAE